MVLSTLDLANPVYEKLVNKYLIDGKWDELLVRMWNAYQLEKSTLSQDESEAILCFINHCISFIENCIRFNILNVTTPSPLPSVAEDSIDEEPASTSPQPTITVNSHTSCILSPSVSERSESTPIPFVYLIY